jgi:hypothetical protein
MGPFANEFVESLFFSQYFSAFLMNEEQFLVEERVESFCERTDLPEEVKADKVETNIKNCVFYPFSLKKTPKKQASNSSDLAKHSVDNQSEYYSQQQAHGNGVFESVLMGNRYQLIRRYIGHYSSRKNKRITNHNTRGKSR